MAFLQFSNVGKKKKKVVCFILATENAKKYSRFCWVVKPESFMVQSRRSISLKAYFIEVSIGLYARPIAKISGKLY
jgi:hypothetical protein